MKNMNNFNVVLALRTHFWDEYIEYISQKLNGSTSLCEFVIIADETKSKFNCSNYNKISHTDDMSEIGIDYFPEFNLWYTGDYPLYILLNTYKDADYFIMVENDVLVNKNIDGIIKYVTSNNIDVIFYDFDNTPGWVWEKTLQESFSNTKKCLFPFLLLSRRVVEYLYVRRKEISKEYKNGKIKYFPYCEGFIASAINELGDSIKISNLNDFFKMNHYSFDNPYYILDPIANMSGSICHPVRGHDFLFRRNIDEIFIETSPLRRGLSLINPDIFFEPIFDRIQKTRSLEKMIQFSDIATKKKWVSRPISINWALGAKAWTSSISCFSIHETVEDEGSAACDGNIHKEYAFHTSEEQSPNLTIELDRIIKCRHIYI